ncbi:MAG: FAD-dependent oxidoreductase [Ilumatobacter sp.]|uniref:NAD(P)/FAD-dependent oxidoreductase n=1 Tax=Ilumatobacter sp. TaxID=1967498 RepID=UPI003C72C59F
MTSRAVDGVLIVGGGYAGVHTARSVRRAGRSASVVDPTGRHDFVTRLAAVAGGTAPTSDAAAPLSDFADDVIIGSMTAVRDGEVDLSDGTTLTADAVVITAGAVPITPPIDGIEHAYPLRTEADALELRAEIETCDAVVIVGGGATGVQLAGAIAAAQPRTAVTIVDVSDRLLAGMGKASGRDAARILCERGVSIRLGSEVDEILEHGVLIDGEATDGLPVWAGGFAARADQFGLPANDEGRLLVDRFLRVEGWTKTFAAGDIALHLTEDGDELPMSAQIAVQAGDAAGRNAVRTLRGDALDRADLGHRGWVLDLGGNRGLAEVGPVALTAPFLDLLPPTLHWGIDMKHLIETRGLAGFNDRPGA